ncbi:hypothetical protein DEU34_2523 [Microbacterium sp. AG1240]|uniref:helix-turn-helix domain-containing protein n=1 Tax=Microbacterium sp. AG1240 TaxID=2183992 RepID=UPI000EAF9B20|nr:helix-turn-helix domain-containing protein [Microbacterium sp. AG1240]RKT31453.1 hypothetical protein DEU34_2523 [Microbacterium sp. AG1240]
MIAWYDLPLSVPRAAALLGISEDEVYEHIDRGELDAAYYDDARITLDELERFELHRAQTAFQVLDGDVLATLSLVNVAAVAEQLDQSIPYVRDSIALGFLEVGIDENGVLCILRSSVESYHRMLFRELYE